MSIKKIVTGLALSLLLGSGSGAAVAADYYSAYSTYQSGDYKAAFKEMLPFAEQGNIDAQWLIAYMYSVGEGVPQNYKTAVKWYTLSAEQGDASAQYNLGMKYFDGQGVLKSYKTAVSWYTKAAEQGHVGAQGNLGVMYDIGYGVPADNRRAYMWYNLAIYNGNTLAPDNQNALVNKMTPAAISKAQDMSSRCLESNYTDC